MLATTATISSEQERANDEEVVGVGAESFLVSTSPNPNSIEARDLSQIDSDGIDEEDKMTAEPLPFYVAVVPAILAGGCDYFGLGVISPLLPYYVRSLGEDEIWIGAVQTAQYCGVICGSIILGRAADTFGRRITMAVALMGDVVFFALTSIAPSVGLLIAVRFFAGVFTPLVASIAWVNDAAQGDQRVLAKNMAAWAVTMSLGFMIGSAVGGSLGQGYFGWLTGHLLSAGLALLALCYVVWVQAPPRKDSDVKPLNLDKICRSPEFLAMAALQVVSGICFTGCILMSILLFLELLDGSPLDLALFLIFTSIFHAFESFTILPASMSYFGSPRAGMVGTSLITLAANILACFSFTYSSKISAGAVLLLTSAHLPIFMTGANLIVPIYAERYGQNAKGAAIGFSRLCFNVGQMMGPIIAVSLFEVTYILWFGCLSVLQAVFLVLWLEVDRKATVKYAQVLTSDGSDKAIKRGYTQQIHSLTPTPVPLQP
jgi:MFS family permease